MDDSVVDTDLYSPQVWVNSLALTAAVISWTSGWRATAMAAVPAPLPPPVTEDEYDQEKTPSSSQTVLDPDLQGPVGLDAGLDEI